MSEGEVLDLVLEIQQNAVKWANLYGWPDKRAKAAEFKRRAVEGWQRYEAAMRALGKIP